MSNPASFEETVRNALFQDGDAVFLICYLHAKREEETVALMREVFWALGAHRQPFSSDRERRVWLYKAAHRAAMDYYAKKYRRNPSSATVRRWGESFPFEVSEELAAVLLLHYPLLTPAALCYGCGEKPEVIAKVTGRPLGLTKRRLKAALEKSGLPRHEMREWLATVTLPDYLLSRLLVDAQKDAADPHFAVQKGAASFQRGFRRVAPFLALGVLALALTAALAVRLNWFRLTPPAPSPSETETAPAPDAPSSPSVSSETQPESAPQRSDPSGEASSQLPENIARFDVAIFLPNETGLTQYNARNVPADAGCIVQEMAARGAFGDGVTLERVAYLKDGEEIESVRSGDQLQVRLYFSEALQQEISETPTLALAEALAKTFRSFFEAADMRLYALEVYAGGEPVSANGKVLDFTALLSGELPITEVIDG